MEDIMGSDDQETKGVEMMDPDEDEEYRLQFLAEFRKQKQINSFWKKTNKLEGLSHVCSRPDVWVKQQCIPLS